MRRDKRLLIALLLFVASAIALLFQAAIVNAYIYAAAMGNWVGWPNPPPKGPNVYCLDYCVADLPFIAGWIGIGTFLLGLLLVARAWWKPKV